MWYVVGWGLAHWTLAAISAIGVDEIQYAKGHKYLTLVYQIDQGNMGLDPTTHRVFIVAAKFGPPSTSGRGRGPVLPGSFTLMVIERDPARH